MYIRAAFCTHLSGKISPDSLLDLPLLAIYDGDLETLPD